VGVKHVAAESTILEVELEHFFGRAKSQALPRNLVFRKQPGLKALRSWVEPRVTHLGKVEEVDVTNMGDVEEGVESTEVNLRTRLLDGLALSALGCGLSDFHKASGKCPESVARLNCSSTEQHLVLPDRERAQNDLGILVMNGFAGGAD